MPGRLTATVELEMGAEESDGALVGAAGEETILRAGKLDFASEVLNAWLDGGPRSSWARWS